MPSNLHTAFDAIRAEEPLKAGTLAFLRREMTAPRPAARSAAPRRLVPVLACLALLVTTGLFAARAYFAPVAYVDLEVNPSVALLFNRFDRVIGTYAYNPEGEALLSALPLRHRDYESALSLLMDEIAERGYLTGDGLLSVTLQTNAAGEEARLLAAIRAEVSHSLSSHHSGTKTEIFPVSGDARSSARILNLSPAKYLAIQALIAVDPTATVEGCRHHSIGELQTMTRAHGVGHHTAAPSSEQDPTLEDAPQGDSVPQYGNLHEYSRARGRHRHQ